eukprot:6490974-Amphidinium_carterae.1
MQTTTTTRTTRRNQHANFSQSCPKTRHRVTSLAANVVRGVSCNNQGSSTPDSSLDKASARPFSLELTWTALNSRPNGAKSRAASLAIELIPGDFALICTNAAKIPRASPTTKIGPAHGKHTQALSANNNVNASQ